MLDARNLPAERYSIFLPAVMNETEKRAYDRGNSGCECSARHTHIHGKHKDIVKDNVKETGKNGTHHGYRGMIVVSNIGGCCVIRHIEEGKGQNGANIGDSQLLKCTVCAKKL